MLEISLQIFSVVFQSFNMWLILLLACTIISIIYFKFQNDYWERRGVPFIKATLCFGNIGGILRMRSSPAEEIRVLYRDKAAQDKPFVGIHIFHQPAILLRDPRLIKQILVRDFGVFCNRYAHADTKADPLGTKNLFFLRDSMWKDVRFKLSPFFTGSRLKNMLHLVEAAACNLDEFLVKQPLEDAETQSFSMEMKELCALYTTDVIGTTAFGIEANSFKNPQNPFLRSGRAVFEFSYRRAIGFILVFFLPKLVSIFNFKVVPNKSTIYLRQLFNTVISEREKSGKPRDDLIDILIKHRRLPISQAPSDKQQQLVFDGDILLAQAAIFFTAGFESSSSTMAFALYELTKHQDIQHRLRKEIAKVLKENNGQVSQTVVDKLDYMKMVIQEVLRLYPPLPFLDRQCTLPAGHEAYSLAPFSSFSIPNGMPVYIPVYALHTDAQYYPQPMTFNPERFAQENKHLITPYTYMPFGLGPHGCIGERFSMMQIKIGLLHILRQYRVEACAKTEANLTLNPKALIMQSNNGIYLSFVGDPLNT